MPEWMVIVFVLSLPVGLILLFSFFCWISRSYDGYKRLQQFEQDAPRVRKLESEYSSLKKSHDALLKASETHSEEYHNIIQQAPCSPDDKRIIEEQMYLLDEKNAEILRLTNRIELLIADKSELEQRLNSRNDYFSSHNVTLYREREEFKQELQKLQENFRTLSVDYNNLKNWVSNTKQLSRALLPKNQSEYTWSKDVDCTRLHHAFAEGIHHSDILTRAKYISAKDGTEYETTLTSCTCPDFKYNTQGKPCKHMYTLALELGIFLLPNHEALRSELTQCTKLKSEIDRERSDIQKIVNTRSQSSPWLAERIAEYYKTIDNKRIDAIPRTTKKDELKRISKEKRDATFKAKMLESQLSYLTHTFPWLEDFITDPPTKEMLAEPTGDTEWDSLKDWISATEYANLSTVEKYQLALDRYESRARSAWEAGIMYERYVGWVYESHDFDVEYRGALDGYDDMGRDIIAKKDGRVYVIQCKRWDKHKTIHEKHIFQLYGSTILYRIDHPQETVIPLFVTTTALSECANAVARELHVTVREDLPLKPYPKIKCNIGKNGEKIYHLPFDQQYDRVIIDKKKGEGYCMTVAEAESLGFRRAHKWISN